MLHLEVELKKGKAWWDPIGFWSIQSLAIQKEVESQVKAYQVYLVQRQADVALAANEREQARIEQAALEETLRVMGVQKKSISPEIQQKVGEALAKADEVLAEGHARLDMA